MTYSTRLFFVAALACFIVVLSHHQAIAAEPKTLYTKGMTAYADGQGDLVEALKYLFAYKLVAENSLNSDPNGKKQLEAAIAYCEDILRHSAIYAASIAANNKKIIIKGTLSKNPYLGIDGNVLQKNIEATMQNISK
jgi:hypothetical protein